MVDGVSVALEPQLFSAGPADLLVSTDFRVARFRYRSGIEGLTIESSVGTIEVLPFVGQQVWRARFHGRDLAMRSTFAEPVASRDYLSNNGAYFIHCGGSAMGNPGDGDDHPLHGELPNARLEDVTITIEREGALSLKGSLTHRVAFGAYFHAELELRVMPGESILESHATITNLSAEPRPLMYLAHVNFLPAVRGTIDDSLRAGERIRARADLTMTDGSGARTVTTAELDAGAVTIADLLAPGVRVEPEVVQSVPALADADGWATARQRHPDGTTDAVSHRTEHLPHTLRWLRRSADDDAFGFALPASAEADGFAAEQRKGHVRTYRQGESLLAVIRHGIERPGQSGPGSTTQRSIHGNPDSDVTRASTPV